MNQFKELANIYNLLYHDKNYEAEATYVHELMQSQLLEKTTNLNIMDVGCGTGMHDFFLAKKGYQMFGVDPSTEMIENAKILKKRPENHGLDIEFETADFSKLPYVEKQLDVILSLFHVVSYLTSNDNLITAFHEVAKKLKSGGLFIFDYWYGPGVFKDPATNRTKKFKNGDFEITRKSTPVHYIEKNLFDITFDFKVLNLKNSKTHTFHEVHSMRYFFIPEIEMFAFLAGFEVVRHLNWMTFDRPELDSWYVLTMLRKK